MSIPLVLAAASAIICRVSRKELKADMVELSWDCRDELLVKREESRGEVTCQRSK